LPVHQFENYDLMLDTESRPIEFGRDAMGVTYRALDKQKLNVPLVEQPTLC
jgi:hypothetical protein